MIALLDTSEDLRVCEAELGCPVEQLLTPLTAFNRQYKDLPFAIDNGAYSGFDASSFERILKRELKARDLCRFVCVPDVVGSARRTREVFDYWYSQIYQWPLAFVAQDGQEDIEIPWRLIKAIFIGGTTQFKMSQTAVTVIRAAQCMGKWVHVGRVNQPGRFEYFDKLGVNSIDGSGLAQYSWMREKIYKAYNSPKLFCGENTYVEQVQNESAGKS
jgi:hypothetical protein